jgi:hypothetical protein
LSLIGEVATGADGGLAAGGLSASSFRPRTLRHMEQCAGRPAAAGDTSIALEQRKQCTSTDTASPLSRTEPGRWRFSSP